MPHETYYRESNEYGNFDVSHASKQILEFFRQKIVLAAHHQNFDVTRIDFSPEAVFPSKDRNQKEYKPAFLISQYNKVGHIPPGRPAYFESDKILKIKLVQLREAEFPLLRLSGLKKDFESFLGSGSYLPKSGHVEFLPDEIIPFDFEHDIYLRPFIHFEIETHQFIVDINVLRLKQNHLNYSNLEVRVGVRVIKPEYMHYAYAELGFNELFYPGGELRRYKTVFIDSYEQEIKNFLSFVFQDASGLIAIKDSLDLDKLDPRSLKLAMETALNLVEQSHASQLFPVWNRRKIACRAFLPKIFQNLQNRKRKYAHIPPIAPDIDLQGALNSVNEMDIVCGMKVETMTSLFSVPVIVNVIILCAMDQDPDIIHLRYIKFVEPPLA